MSKQQIEPPKVRRRRVLQALAAAGMGSSLAGEAIAQPGARLSARGLHDASVILGEDFSDQQMEVIHAALERNLIQFQGIRDFEVDDRIPPAPQFVSKRYKT